ncbi:alpha/beta hydrolase family protein [Pontibacter locisalis]|uniref:Alpha/beta hydrolase family protein n=1 Tax=Pontibacter locisalis TaxID=1719035 RepID=A0ABW5IHI9_9BACT
MKALSITLLLCLLICSKLQAQIDQKPTLVTWKEIAAMPLPAADHVIKYGSDSLQFGELRLPEGKGPFPVVVVVHGGCWLSAYNLQYMSHVSEALTKAGYATWNIEFRRVGDEGGGFPGTFQDVAKATDYVKELAKKHPLNAKEVAVLGHSAGGHLALWLGARRNLSRKSDLFTKKPLKIKGIVSLAGIPNLASYSEQEGSCNSAVQKLMGALPAEASALYADASPAELLPLRVPQRMVQGELDPIVPVAQSQLFTEAAKAKGDDNALFLIPEAGHFDLVAPHSPAWSTVLKAVQEVLPLKGK